MSQADKLVGAIGLIRIDALEITVAPIPDADELALDRALRAAADKAAGDYVTRCHAELDALKSEPALRVEFVRELARMAGRKDSLSGVAMHDFRCSKDGLPIELFFRGRANTPGLTLAGLQAIITEVNADQIAAAMFKLFEGDDKKSA